MLVRIISPKGVKRMARTESSGAFPVVMTVVLILAIIGLAYLSLFQPGGTSEWKIKFGDLEILGSSVGLGFGLLLCAVLWMLRSDLRASFRRISAAGGKAVLRLFRLFRTK